MELNEACCCCQMVSVVDGWVASRPLFEDILFVKVLAFATLKRLGLKHLK